MGPMVKAALQHFVSFLHHTQAVQLFSFLVCLILTSEDFRSLFIHLFIINIVIWIYEFFFIYLHIFLAFDLKINKSMPNLDLDSNLHLEEGEWVFWPIKQILSSN